MSDHMDRVNREYEQLVEKINALRIFVQSDTFQTLATFDQDLLLAQRGAMEIYSTILLMRIRRSEENESR